MPAGCWPRLRETHGSSVSKPERQSMAVQPIDPCLSPDREAKLVRRLRCNVPCCKVVTFPTVTLVGGMRVAPLPASPDSGATSPLNVAPQSPDTSATLSNFSTGKVSLLSPESSASVSRPPSTLYVWVRVNGLRGEGCAPPQLRRPSTAVQCHLLS